ncbi:hypothetical protein OO012_09430 [Rhodobacteraceae bacterium KMM 6894]|nr:hypothetical protein [Rhodobacteraceae bacterium KMM 6894]
MKRFAILSALCLPLGGLAIAGDETGQFDTPVIEIHVEADELSSCRETLDDLNSRDVFTDRGTRLPALFGSTDEARTVCVLDV